MRDVPVLDNLGLDSLLGRLYLRLALDQLQLHHGGCRLVQTRPLRRLPGVVQGPSQDGLHGGDRPLQGQLDVSPAVAQPGSAQRGEEVPSPWKYFKKIFQKYFKASPTKAAGN